MLALVLVALAVLVALLIARSRRQGREAEWRRSALSAVGAAELARDLVLNQAPSDDPQRRASVAVQVDEAAGALDGEIQQKIGFVAEDLRYKQGVTLSLVEPMLEPERQQSAQRSAVYPARK